MNPDQTAPWEQSDLGPYYLQECKQQREHPIKGMSDGETVKLSISSHRDKGAKVDDLLKTG